MKVISIQRLVLFLCILCVFGYLGKIGQLNLEIWKSLSDELLGLLGVYTILSAFVLIKLFKVSSRYDYSIWLERKLKYNDFQLLRIYRRNVVLRKANSEFTPLIAIIFDRSLLVLVVFLIGYSHFNNQDIVSIREVPSRYNLSSERYCPTQDNHQEEQSEKPGCELIRKAYDLGYTKSLGDCANEKDKQLEVCRLRHVDEPFLHFLVRQIKEKINPPVAPTNQQVDHEKPTNTGEEISYKSLASSLTSKAKELSGGTNEVNFVLTNLPRPLGKLEGFLQDLFRPGHCSSLESDFGIYANPAENISETLIQATHQLLFDTALAADAEYCRNYKIVWEAPKESCKNLTKNPNRTLKNLGILGTIDSVLDKTSIPSPSTHKSIKQGPDPLLPQEKSISFHCLIFEESTGEKGFVIEESQVELKERKFDVNELKANKPTTSRQVLIYLAYLLKPGFHKHVLDENNERNLNAKPSGGPAPSAYVAFFLSNLDAWSNTNIFYDADFSDKFYTGSELYSLFKNLSTYVHSFRTYKTNEMLLRELR